MRKLFFILFATGITGSTVAQEKVWTLKECVQYAYDHNLSIKQAELSLEMDEIALEESEWAKYPGLNASASRNYNFGRSIDPLTNTTGIQKNVSNYFSMSSSATLFNGFLLRNREKQNETRLAAKTHYVDKIRNDISMNIALFYLEVLFNQESITNNKAQLEIARQQVARIQKLVDVGSLPKGSLFEMESQMASEEQRVIQAESSYEISRLNLTQLLDITNYQNFLVEAPKFGDPILDTEGLTTQYVYQEALKSMPQIKQAELDVKAADQGIDIARASLYPRLSVSASLSTRANDDAERAIGHIDSISGQPVYDFVPYAFDEQIEDYFGQSVGLNLNIPIFNGRSARLNIQRSEVQKAQALLTKENTENQLLKDIQKAQADVLAAYKGFIAAKKSVQSFQEAFNYVKKKHDLGIVNAVENNDAKTKLNLAISQMTQSKYDYIFKRMILAFYQGQPIKL